MIILSISITSLINKQAQRNFPEYFLSILFYFLIYKIKISRSVMFVNWYLILCPMDIFHIYIYFSDSSDPENDSYFDCYCFLILYYLEKRSYPNNSWNILHLILLNPRVWTEDFITSCSILNQWATILWSQLYWLCMQSSVPSAKHFYDKIL